MSMTFSRKAVIIYTLAVIAVFAFVAGCGNDGMHAYSGSPSYKNSSRSAAGDSLGVGGPAADKFAESVPATPDGRKIIMTYDLTVKVEDFGKAFDAASQLAGKSGGYALNTRRQKADNGSVSGWIVMRVPKEKAGSALDELRKLGEVIEESSTGDDITEQYVDMAARLRNLSASEERLLGLMKTNTKRLDDLLTVEKELTRVRGEIESKEAQIRNWDTLTSMVTIKLSLREPGSSVPSGSRFWDPISSAFGKAAEGFAQSAHFAIIFVGTVIPWVLLFGLIAYVIYRLAKRKARKSVKAEKEPDDNPAE